MFNAKDRTATKSISHDFYFFLSGENCWVCNLWLQRMFGIIILSSLQRYSTNGRRLCCNLYCFTMKTEDIQRNWLHCTLTSVGLSMHFFCHVYWWSMLGDQFTWTKKAMLIAEALESSSDLCLCIINNDILGLLLHLFPFFLAGVTFTYVRLSIKKSAWRFLRLCSHVVSSKYRKDCRHILALDSTFDSTTPSNGEKCWKVFKGNR